MERCFIVGQDSPFMKDMEKYREKDEKQRQFVNEFFKVNSIESNAYLVGGSGFVNRPFDEHSKGDIVLSIDPTENDRNLYGSMILKPNSKSGLCAFRKNSKIAKLFADGCIQNEIVVNLWKPRIGDYFTSLYLRSCSWETFTHEGVFYLRVESDDLKKTDKAEGLTEIKQSQYFQAREALEAKTTLQTL